MKSHILTTSLCVMFSIALFGCGKKTAEESGDTNVSKSKPALAVSKPKPAAARSK